MYVGNVRIPRSSNKLNKKEQIAGSENANNIKYKYSESARIDLQIDPFNSPNGRDAFSKNKSFSKKTIMQVSTRTSKSYKSMPLLTYSEY